MNKEPFRILDLGAHDGFVTLWIARQMRERDIEVEICGLELHPGAVEIANRRANDEGFVANYVQGLAEDAPKHWPVCSFDAVVSFEVIEHVLNVPEFLSTCETMCKHDGRVYLSTPNGCFGSGNNPHHLRVYRDIDMFNLMRKRGTVQGLHQGADGVTVCSYTPQAFGAKYKGEAAIYAGPGWEKWHPRDIEERGLGGSETAASMVAQALSDQGYVVTLYGEVEEGMWQQVELRHHTVFDPMDERELLIVSRVPAIFDRPIRAKRKVFWMHDTDYGPDLTPEHMQKMDAIYTLSDWHWDHVDTLYSEARCPIYTTINGINPAFFPKDKIPTDRPRRAIYSSSPDRGLDLMLKLWPRVREQVPDAELVYCYADVYNRVADVQPALAAFRDKVRDLASQDGVVNLGALSQPNLASAMATCRVWLAPSYNTIHDVPFNETFCIGAVEAAAAGCHRIMSNWGALPERFNDGESSLIGSPFSEDGWVAQIVKHLTNDDCVYHQSPEAMKYLWSVTASDLAG